MQTSGAEYEGSAMDELRRRKQLARSSEQSQTPCGLAQDFGRLPRAADHVDIPRPLQCGRSDIVVEMFRLVSHKASHPQGSLLAESRAREASWVAWKAREYWN